MTDDRAARLSAIAAEAATRRTISDFEGMAHYSTVLEGHRDWLLAELTAERARAEEVAGLLRDAAGPIHNQSVTGSDEYGYHCRDCGAKEITPGCPLKHEPDCLVTRLRTAAEWVKP